jgi:hypothetical protein
MPSTRSTNLFSNNTKILQYKISSSLLSLYQIRDGSKRLYLILYLNIMSSKLILRDHLAVLPSQSVSLSAQGTTSPCSDPNSIRSLSDRSPFSIVLLIRQLGYKRVRGLRLAGMGNTRYCIILFVVMLQGGGIFKYPLGLSGSYFFILQGPVIQSIFRSPSQFRVLYSPLLQPRHVRNSKVLHPNPPPLIPLIPFPNQLPTPHKNQHHIRPSPRFLPLPQHHRLPRDPLRSTPSRSSSIRAPSSLHHK